MTEKELREKLKKMVLTEEEQEMLERKKGGSDWPDSYCVPPKHVDIDKETTRTKYENPREKDAMFFMPPSGSDFQCQCGGDYGPWVHRGFSVNMDGGYGSKPIYANLLHERKRWCEDCGHEHFNCYSPGAVVFDRSHNGILRLDEFVKDKDERKSL